MRFARLAAFALWLMVALLAVAGFAAFSPETATITTTSSTVAAPVSAGADWGLTSGRVVALAFSSGLRSAPGPTDLSTEDALILDLLGERPEVTTTTVNPSDAAAELVASTRATIPTTTTTLRSSTTTTAASVTVAATGPDNEDISETEVRGIISLFFAPQDVELALEVAHCESRWDPDATNPSSRAAGLFQQIPRFWTERAAAAGWAGADIYDAHANTAVSAWLVYEGGGWIHWAESQGCWG
jgi:hypothetical protein